MDWLSSKGVELSSKMLPLVLSVKCENWRMDDVDAADADAEFAKVRRSALERDNYSCRFCTFRHLKYQEVHHANDDHADNRLSNLITTCTFCHMCQHIGLAGKNKSATLVWLPEISQADLNHIVRTSLVAQRLMDGIKNDLKAVAATVNSYRETADIVKSTMAVIMSREEEAENRLGSSDPLEIGNAMRLLPDEIYAKRSNFLSGIRLLPLGRNFQGGTDLMQKQVDSWIEPGGPYMNLKPNTWPGLIRSVLA